MKMLLLVAVLASAALIACTGSSNSAEESSTPTPIAEAAQAASPTPADTFACPSPTPCPDCPEPTACPTCPTCPEPVTCPTCRTCPVCPEPITCPPAANPLSDSCAAVKLGIETYQLVADVGEKGQLVGSLSETLAMLASLQTAFDQGCQNVPFAEPSNLTEWCSIAGGWKGTLERENLHAPTVQNQLWINQFASIIEDYCSYEGP